MAYRLRPEASGGKGSSNICADLQGDGDGVNAEQFADEEASTGIASEYQG